MRVNMLQEFGRLVSKYWFSMMVKLSFCMTHYLSMKDVNFGMTSNDKFEWITLEGRLSLIYNSTFPNDEEKKNL